MTRWHGHHQRVAPYGARARMPSPTSIQLGKAHVVEIATQPFDCEGRLKQADLRFRFLGTRELGRCSKGLPLRYRITGYALVGTEGLRAIAVHGRVKTRSRYSRTSAYGHRVWNIFTQ
jgi:hypothetical protein